MVDICYPKVNGSIFGYSEFLRIYQIIGFIIIHDCIPGWIGIFVGQVIYIGTEDLPVLECMLKVDISHDMAPLLISSCHPGKGIRRDGIPGIGNVLGAVISTGIHSH
jgi:hypothetical protein